MDTLAKECDDNISTILQKGPYSIATDASTDMESIKVFPLVVKYFDSKQGKVMCKLLCLVVSSKPLMGIFFQIMDHALEERGITWQNSMSLGADNANVMQGLRKGVAVFVKKIHPSVFMLGCPCHLMILAAETACKQLPVVVEYTLIDVFYYLDKNSNRH